MYHVCFFSTDLTCFLLSSIFPQWIFPSNQQLRAHRRSDPIRIQVRTLQKPFITTKFLPGKNFSPFHLRFNFIYVLCLLVEMFLTVRPIKGLLGFFCTCGQIPNRVVEYISRDNWTLFTSTFTRTRILAWITWTKCIEWQNQTNVATFQIADSSLGFK